MDRRRLAWLGSSAALVILGAGLVALRNPTPTADAVEAADRAAPAAVPSPLRATAPAGADAPAATVPDYARPVPRGTERPVAIPRDLQSGIRCPDGTFLPLLNGVPYAGTLSRDPELSGPLPRVVAKRTEADGTEWWIHADGSATTTRWTELRHHGKAEKVVVVDHLQPVNADGIEHLPGDRKPGK